MIDLNALSDMIVDCDVREAAYLDKLEPPHTAAEARMRIGAQRQAIMVDLLFAVVETLTSDVGKAPGPDTAEAPAATGRPVHYQWPNATGPNDWRCDVTPVEHPPHTWYVGDGKYWRCRGEEVPPVVWRPIRDAPQA